MAFRLPFASMSADVLTNDGTKQNVPQPYTVGLCAAYVAVCACMRMRMLSHAALQSSHIQVWKGISCGFIVCMRCSLNAARMLRCDYTDAFNPAQHVCARISVCECVGIFLLLCDTFVVYGVIRFRIRSNCRTKHMHSCFSLLVGQAESYRIRANVHWTAVVAVAATFVKCLDNSNRNDSQANRNLATHPIRIERLRWIRLWFKHWRHRASAKKLGIRATHTNDEKQAWVYVAVYNTTALKIQNAKRNCNGFRNEGVAATEEYDRVVRLSVERQPSFAAALHFNIMPTSKRQRPTIWKSELCVPVSV